MWGTCGVCLSSWNKQNRALCFSFSPLPTMPRPGSKPYDCVKRAWHSEIHQPIRGTLIQEIFRSTLSYQHTHTKKEDTWVLLHFALFFFFFISYFTLIFFFFLLLLNNNRVVNEIHGSSTKKNKEYQEKLPVVVLRAEEIIYSKANSEVTFPLLSCLSVYSTILFYIV